MSFNVGELVAVMRLNKSQWNTAIAEIPSQAQKAGNSVDKAMTGVEKSTDGVASGVGKAAAAFRAFATQKLGAEKVAELDQLGVKVQDYVEALDGVPGAQDKVRAALKSSGEEAGRLEGFLSDLEAASRDSSTRLDGLGESAVGTSGDADRLKASLDGAGGSAGDLKSKADAAGTAVAGAGSDAGAAAGQMGAGASSAGALASSLDAVGAAGRVAGTAGAELAGIGAAGAAAAAGAETASSALDDVARSASDAERASGVYAAAGGRVADELTRTKDNVVVDGTLANAAVVAAGGLGSIADAGEDAKTAIEDMGASAQSSGQVSTAAMVAVAEATDDAAQRQANLGNATGNSGAAAQNTGNAFKVMAGVIAGAGVVSYIQDSVTAGSDLNETMSKSEQIFGSAAGKVEEFGNTAAKSVGLSKGEAVAAAANFGNMFTQIGYTSEAAADLSTKTVQMAADLGSFNNMPTADVADKIAAAFNGEYDSLQSMIPAVNAARVETEALTASGKTSADQLTAQEKATAVLKIIQEDGAKAMGDYARTADGFANSQKSATAEIQSQKEALGQELLPVAAQVMELFGSVGIPILGSFSTALGGVAEFALPVVQVLGDVVKWVTELPTPVLTAAAAITAMAILGPSVAGLGAAFTAMKAKAIAAATALKVGFLTNPIGLAIVGIATAASFFVGGADDAAAATEEWNGKVADLAGTLDKATGAVTDLTKQKIRETISDAEIAKMESYGINTSAVLDAMTNVPGAMNTATASITAQANRVIEASQGYREYSSVLAKAGVGLDDLAAGLIQGGAPLDQLNAKLATAGLSVADFGNGTVGLRSTLDGSTVAITNNADFLSYLQTAYQRTGSESEKLTQAQKNLEAGNKAAAGSTDKMADAAAAAVEPAVDLGDEMRKNRDAANEVSDAISILQNRLTELAGGEVDAQQASREHQATIRAVAAAARDQAAAAAEVTSKQEALADVQKHLNDSNKDTRTTTADVEAAQRDLDDAVAGVSDAADRQASSLDDLAKSGTEQVARVFEATKANSTYDQAVQAATATMQQQRDQFVGSAIDAGYSQEAAENLANAQGLIPANVATAYQDIHADESQKAAEDLKKAVENVPANRTITIGLNDMASAGISGLATAIAGLPSSKTVGIKINATTTAQVAGGSSAAQIQGAMLDAIGVRWMGGTAQGLAAGGVPGSGLLPGTPPADRRVDNLLAIGPSGRPLRLRSKEFIEPQETTEYYGVGVLEALRQRSIPREWFQSLPGFAGGGAVSVDAPPVRVSAAPAVRSVARGLAGSRSGAGNTYQFIAQVENNGQEITPALLLSVFKELERTHGP